VQQELVQQKLANSALQEQTDTLLKQQHLLQAELELALGTYEPKARIDANTPADKLLAMMSDLLDGSLPTVEDILLVQSSVLEGGDIYQPFRLGKQLLENRDLEEDVSRALIRELADSRTVQQVGGWARRLGAGRWAGCWGAARARLRRGRTWAAC
jgi:hypothetical protein